MYKFDGFYYLFRYEDHAFEMPKFGLEQPGYCLTVNTKNNFQIIEPLRLTTVSL